MQTISIFHFVSLLISFTLCVLMESKGLEQNCGAREYESEAGVCTPCRVCDGGTQLSEPCGYGKGARALCVPCPPGRYSTWDNEGIMGGEIGRRNGLCRPCKACHLLHRNTVSNCTRSHNAMCGLCMDGFYLREHLGGLTEGDCLPCGDLTHNEEKQCARDGSSTGVANEDKLHNEVTVTAVVCGILSFILLAVIILSLIYLARILKRPRSVLTALTGRGKKPVNPENGEQLVKQNMAQNATAPDAPDLDYQQCAGDEPASLRSTPPSPTSHDKSHLRTPLPGTVETNPELRYCLGRIVDAPTPVVRQNYPTPPPTDLICIPAAPHHLPPAKHCELERVATVPYYADHPPCPGPRVLGSQEESAAWINRPLAGKSSPSSQRTLQPDTINGCQHRLFNKFLLSVRDQRLM
uniref:tumor necrosis factor receptor superfamily member 27-like isoform X3 n=1 Tax=Myxine glutinosa TaxID=7769 RepID=UPI00358EA4DA